MQLKPRVLEDFSLWIDCFQKIMGRGFLGAQVMLLNKGKFYELNVKHRF